MKKMLVLLGIIIGCFSIQACSSKNKESESISIPELVGRYSTNSLIEESSSNSSNSNNESSLETITSSSIVSSSEEISSSLEEELAPVEALNLAISRYTNSKYVKSVTTGKVKAKALIFDYNQSMAAMKILNDEIAYCESISTSTFIKVGLQRVIVGTSFFERNGDPKSLSSVDWDDEFDNVSYEDYIIKYGNLPYGLFPYVFSGNIISSSYIGTVDGLLHYSFELDPEAAVNYKREIKTTSDSSDYPDFSHIDFEMALDENYYPISITRNETYKIDLLGGVTCKTSLTESFTYSDEEFELPVDLSIFDAYIS